MKSKNYKDVSSSIRRISNKVLTQDDLEKRIIIQKGNTYQVYGDYTLEETEFGWQVTSDRLSEALVFNTAKVALAWCILYKVGNFATAQHMQWLDNRISAKQMDVDILMHMLESEEPTLDRATLLARLSEDINNRQSYKKQLMKYVKQAKYIKLKGTHNELNRFNKTSRRNRSR